MDDPVKDAYKALLLDELRVVIEAAAQTMGIPVELVSVSYGMNNIGKWRWKMTVQYEAKTNAHGRTWYRHENSGYGQAIDQCLTELMEWIPTARDRVAKGTMRWMHSYAP